MWLYYTLALVTRISKHLPCLSTVVARLRGFVGAFASKVTGFRADTASHVSTATTISTFSASEVTTSSVKASALKCNPTVALEFVATAKVWN